MTGLVISIIWVAALIFIVERLRSTVMQLPGLRPEQRAVPQEKLPADLVGLALMESEEWAQEEMLAAMREAHDKLGDWNAVRARFGVSKPEDIKE